MPESVENLPVFPNVFNTLFFFFPSALSAWRLSVAFCQLSRYFMAFLEYMRRGTMVWPLILCCPNTCLLLFYAREVYVLVGSD